MALIAERTETATPASSSPTVAIVGNMAKAAPGLASRLAELVPPGWQCRSISDFDSDADTTRLHNDSPIAMIVLACADGDRFDTACLGRRVEQAAGLPVVVAGHKEQLPPRGACIRAHIAERIDVTEAEDLIDAGLARAIRQAAQQKRLAELERLNADNPAGTAPAPIADARISLHRHLAGVVSRLETGCARGLIFVAVDGVPALQQQFGVAGADELLGDIGLYLVDGLVDHDRCFRFAPGEYVLSVERAAASEIADAAGALARGVREARFASGQRAISATASIASIVLGGDPSEHDRSLQRLSEAAYELRNAGGNDCRICEREPLSDDRSDAESAADIRPARLKQALTADRFRLAFQTVTSLAGDHRRYYDVLLRYLDNHDQLVRPAQFLPAAESAGLMPEIDRWVTRRAATVVADQAARSMEVALFVKLSIATLDNAQAFAEWLDAEQAIGTIDRQQLIFCVRESDARAHVAGTRRLADALDQAGFRFALTHFGQEDGRAAMLDNIALSFIKLAPDFARRLAEQNTADARLQRVIDYARAHRIPLIAEHIEDAESMARLWQAGVNYVQGHFIQEPDTAAIQSGA